MRLRLGPPAKGYPEAGEDAEALSETESDVKKTWIGAERPDHVRAPRR